MIPVRYRKRQPLKSLGVNHNAHFSIPSSGVFPFQAQTKNLHQVLTEVCKRTVDFGFVQRGTITWIISSAEQKIPTTVHRFGTTVCNWISRSHHNFSDCKQVRKKWFAKVRFLVTIFTNSHYGGRHNITSPILCHSLCCDISIDS